MRLIDANGSGVHENVTINILIIHPIDSWPFTHSPPLFTPFTRFHITINIHTSFISTFTGIRPPRPHMQRLFPRQDVYLRHPQPTHRRDNNNYNNNEQEQADLPQVLPIHPSSRRRFDDLGLYRFINQIPARNPLRNLFTTIPHKSPRHPTGTPAEGAAPNRQNETRISYCQQGLAWALFLALLFSIPAGVGVGVRVEFPGCYPTLPNLSSSHVHPSPAADWTPYIGPDRTGPKRTGH